MVASPHLKLIAGPTPGEFKLTGELDLASFEAVQDYLVTELGRPGPLTLDLSGLGFMDSHGLLMLVRLGGAARSEGHERLVVLNPPPAIRRILELALPDGIPGVEVRVA